MREEVTAAMCTDASTWLRAAIAARRKLTKILKERKEECMKVLYKMEEVLDEARDNTRLDLIDIVGLMGLYVGFIASEVKKVGGKLVAEQLRRKFEEHLQITGREVTEREGAEHVVAAFLGALVNGFFDGVET